jgi:hypothetical protein
LRYRYAEAPSKPEFGFEAGTSGLAPPPGMELSGTSTAVGYATTPPAAAMLRSSPGLSAVGVITTAFWVGMGTAAVVGVSRVVAWQGRGGVVLLLNVLVGICFFL